jgi:erythromycin esterase
MRSYNQAPGKHALLSFTSFDMQMAHEAGRMALEYLGRYARGEAQAAAETYTDAQMLETRRAQIYDDQAKGLADRAAEVVKVFDLKRTALVAASSPEAWRDARQAAAIVYQSCTMRIPGKGPAWRDESMAGNVDWLRHVYPNEKIVLWAHNSHVSFGTGPKTNMGSRLLERYDKEMYVVGFAFNSGSLRAIGMENGKPAALSVYNVPPSQEGSGDAILSAAGLPLFFLDMANIPAGGPLGRWLSTPHLFNSVSDNWVVGNPDSNLEPEALARLYDGLVFVEESHAARGM